MKTRAISFNPKTGKINGEDLGNGKLVPFNEPQHTPTPWGIRLSNARESWIIETCYPGRHDIFLVADTLKDGPIGKKDAAYIVRAVNAHQELVRAALRAIAALAANGAPNCEAVKELKQAIAKAEGK